MQLITINIYIYYWDLLIYMSLLEVLHHIASHCIFCLIFPAYFHLLIKKWVALWCQLLTAPVAPYLIWQTSSFLLLSPPRWIQMTPLHSLHPAPAVPATWPPTWHTWASVLPVTSLPPLPPSTLAPPPRPISAHSRPLPHCHLPSPPRYPSCR